MIVAIYLIEDCTTSPSLKKRKLSESIEGTSKQGKTFVKQHCLMFFSPYRGFISPHFPTCGKDVIYSNSNVRSCKIELREQKS